MTGSELTDRKVELLKNIGIVEFTLDSPPEKKNFARPEGFHLSSVLIMEKCVKEGIKVRAVTVLYPLTMKEANLKSVYRILCDIGVAEWELLRFYPVGRARRFSRLMPSKEGYLKTMGLLKTFRGSTRIFFQHSLRMLEGKGVCPAVNEAIGILPDGCVSACAWALNNQAQPISDYFMLGKVPQQKIMDIVKITQQRNDFQKEANESRIIDYLLNSKKQRKG